MRPLTTEAIILKRTNYGEADRIMTLLSRDYGKLHVIAKGVRKSTSKLAGGIELFSVSRVSFIKGKGEIDTLTTTQLLQNYDKLLRDYDITRIGYEIIAWTNSATEDACEQSYFDLLQLGFSNLNTPSHNSLLIREWYAMQLLMLTGYEIELDKDANDEPLNPSEHYEFDFDSGRFAQQTNGSVRSGEIKLLRLLRVDDPGRLNTVQGIDASLSIVTLLLDNCLRYYLRIKM